MPTKDYEIPRFGLQTERILPWLLEAVQEGDAWLKAQPPSGDWEGVRALLSSTDGAEKVEGLSQVGYNKAKRTARELVASLANFTHEGEFTVAWDQQLFDTAALLTNLDRNWADVCQANVPHRSALQYGVGFGTGYLYETWDKHYWSAFAGDIRLDALAPGDVTFVQLPKNHDIQRAYAVIIREELPINLAKAIYGQSNRAFADALTPDRDSPGWLAKGLRKVQQFLSPALRVAGRMQPDSSTSFPTVDIFHMYTLDQSLNTGPTPVQMGPWSNGRPTIAFTAAAMMSIGACAIRI